MPLVALGTMVAGAALGLINGLLVARLGLPAIVVTLATLVAWREGLRFATEGVWVQDLPAGFQWFGLGQDIGRWLVGLAAAAVWAASPSCSAGRRPAAPSTPPARTPRWPACSACGRRW